MSNQQIEKIGDYPFEVDARVAIQLGRESISSSIVAIFELIKNSYDADAENVDLIFSSNSLCIKDNGHGMSKDQLVNDWLTIGTKSKLDYSRSKKKKRILTGEKGLGRLGIDRICEKLTLETKSTQDDFFYRLVIQWDRYKKNIGNSLSQITHELFKVPISLSEDFSKETQGTILKLDGLKDDWYYNDAEMLITLKKELTLLISPFEGINDFNVSMISGLNDDKIDGTISSEKYLTAAEWIIDAEIDNDKVSIQMTSPFHKKTFSLENVEWSNWLKGRKDKPSCGSLKLKFYFYLPKKRRNKIDFSSKEITEFTTNNCGVRIYRDKFRVLPYGSPNGEGDWLTLQHRRAKEPAGIKRRTWKVGLHQVVGAVFISKEENELLIDQTNREGIVEEEPFFDLRAFALNVIQWFESKRYEFEQLSVDDDKPRSSQKKEVNKLNFEINSEIKELKDLVSTKGSVSSVIKKVSQLEEKISNKEKAAEKYEEMLEQELDMLSNLASIGILTVTFGHESLEQSNFALNAAKELKENYENGAFELLEPYNANVREDIELIISSTDYINNFAKFALGNVRVDKRKLINVPIKKTIKTVFGALDRTLINRNVEYDISGINSCNKKIRGFPIDWESIFMNLITNSIYALKKVTNRERKILVEIHEESGTLNILFSDSGIGIEAGTEDSIFLPNFSTKRDQKGNLFGTGMGLAIVKTFVEDHSSGTISVKNKGLLSGATFNIRVPYVKEK